MGFKSISIAATALVLSTNVKMHKAGLFAAALSVAAVLSPITANATIWQFDFQGDVEGFMQLDVAL